MKKLLVLFLIFAMLLPMGVVAQAEEAEIKPFYLLQWGGKYEGMDYVWGMPFFWTDSSRLSMPTESISWGTHGYNIETLAENLKETFDEYPAGARYIMYTQPQTTFHKMCEDIIYVDEAVASCQEWLEEFLSYYKSIGGKLDGLIVDVELEDISWYFMHSRHFVKNSQIYSQIVENPQFDTDIRPLLDERGFKYYANVTEHTPELYTLHPSSGSEYDESRVIWDNVIRSYINGKVTEACAPLFKYYPDAEMNDYQSKNTKAWLMHLNDSGGASDLGGNTFTAGTSSNANFYSVRPYRFFEDAQTKGPSYNKLPGYVDAVYENKVFNHFIYDVNVCRNVQLASDNGDVSWWISHYRYNEEDPHSASLTPYYAETLLHMGMLNPQMFNGYIIQNEIGSEDEYRLSLQIVDDVLKDLTRLCGNADREAINVAPSWNDHYMLSGMRVGNKNVWRLTPDTALVSVEDFKVEGTDPTFYVEGQTVTFPQGKIIPDGKVSGYDADENLIDNNTCGYWIETPAGVNPIETRADNYYVEYPAYEENYDSYDVNMEYNFKNALPVSCWEVKKVGNSSATVVANPADANDKVLALKGTYTLRNVNMPKNITAGDTYAEDQVWEVSVTVPADLSAEAEIVLLSAAGDKKKSNDGGFKIAGGKVYYSQDGEYMELKGVTLNAGVEYRLKREVNFNNAEQHTSSYYVYDNTGALLGKAKNVAMFTIELPVTQIVMSCSKVEGEAVLLDNYKLYPAKVGSDFTLYTARLGMKLTDLEKPVEENVAYRYSWTNATNVEKSYSVVAQYYNGDTMTSEEVVKEIKMAPNSEGIDCGIVELADKGKAVKVYIKDNNPPEVEDDPDTGVGDDNGNDDNTNDQNDSFALDTKMIIIIAAAAAVLIAVIIIVIVVSAKKKAAKKVAAAVDAPAVEEAPAEVETSAEETPAEETPVEETPENDAE